MKDKQFAKWLEDNSSLSEKSARDVLSRLNRVSHFGAKLNESQNQILLKLNNNSDFQNLSITVRSQLRRAVRLYKQFKKD